METKNVNGIKSSIRRYKETRKRNAKKGNSIRKKYTKKGGDISPHIIFKNIQSIGFEIESIHLVKFTIEPDHENNEDILVNSSLTNADLEYGYYDEYEYTYIIDEPDTTFKITNDSAEDTDFNEELYELYKIHQNYNKKSNEIEEKSPSPEDEGEEEALRTEDDCDEVMFKMHIPKNEYINQEIYNVKIRDPDLLLKNCSSFTDTEWIITYYKPTVSKNVIMDYFLKSMDNLIDHVNKLVTIPNSEFHYLNENNEYVLFPKTKVNQAYILPSTSLVYYNSSLKDNTNYDIKNDLEVMVQMTFGCNIHYVYRIMKQLLSIEYSTFQLEKMNLLRKYLIEHDDKKNIKYINEEIEHKKNNEYFDAFALDNSIEMVKILIDNYQKTSTTYLFPTLTSDLNKKLRSYLFMILYKLCIYLNSYLNDKELHPSTMLKKNLSFAVRHSNYFLFLEMKKILREIFASEFNEKDESYIDTEIINIIHKLIDDKVILRKMYFNSYVRDKKMKLLRLFKSKENTEEYEELKKTHFGNPLYSILSYFMHFSYGNQSDSENNDWLVLNNIDEKSTKFELSNDNIIIEFRDFPNYVYIELFINGNNEVRDELMKTNIGIVNTKLIKKYMKHINYTSKVH